MQTAAEAAVEEALEGIDLESRVEKAFKDHDFNFDAALEREAVDFDFSTYAEEAVKECDIEEQVEEAVNNTDFETPAQDAVLAFVDSPTFRHKLNELVADKVNEQLLSPNFTQAVFAAVQQELATALFNEGFLSLLASSSQAPAAVATGVQFGP